MKQIATLLLLAVLISACQSGSDADGTERNQTPKKANEFIKVEEGPVYTFTVVPDQYNSCRAVFAQSEEEMTSGNFILATDLNKSCVLAIDGRMIQVDIRSKQTSNPSAQFYKFEGNGYMIDLEIRQTEIVAHNLKKVRAQLRIFSQSGFRDIFYIVGEIDC